MTISESFEARIIALKGEGKVEKTFKNYRYARNSLITVVGDIPIELLRTNQVNLWNLYMRQEGLSDTTILTNHAKLKSVLKYLLINDMSVMEPRKINSPKADTVPPIGLTTEDIHALIEAAGNVRDKAVIALIFLTGARPSEILGLDKDTILHTPVDDKGYQEIVVLAKGKKYRPLFIKSDARKYIEAYLETRRSPITNELDHYAPLFMSAQKRRLGLSMVEKMLHKVAGHAGLDKRVTPYVLRHSRATTLLENEAPIELVSKMLGHTHVGITSRVYSHVRTSSQKDMLDKYSVAI